MLVAELALGAAGSARLTWALLVVEEERRKEVLVELESVVSRWQCLSREVLVFLLEMGRRIESRGRRRRRVVMQGVGDDAESGRQGRVGRGGAPRRP